MLHPETQGKARMDQEIRMHGRDPYAKASRGWKSGKLEQLLRRESEYYDHEQSGMDRERGDKQNAK